MRMGPLFARQPRLATSQRRTAREKNFAQQERTPLAEPTSVCSAAKVKPAARELQVALDVRLVPQDVT